MMPDPVINLITSPDKLFNNDTSLLLVNPNTALKESFNELAKDLNGPVNLYLFENQEYEIQWLLDVCQSVNYIVLDIDNTKNNHWIIGHILDFGKTFYLTNTEDSVYNSININRVYELKQFVEGANYFEK